MNHNIPGKPELIGKEPIGIDESLRLVAVVRALLPETSAQVFEVPGSVESEDFDSVDSVSLVIGAYSKYDTQSGHVELEESYIDTSGYSTVVATVRRTREDGGVIRSEIMTYAVYLADMSTSFTMMEHDDRPRNETHEGKTELEWMRDLVRQASIKMQVDQIVGDDILTQERLDELLAILSECSPNNRIN